MKRVLAVLLAALTITIVGGVGTAQANTGVGSGPYTRAQLNRFSDGSGEWMFVYGASYCSASTTDTADFSWSSMPSGWDNDISRIYDAYNCDVKLYDLTWFSGYATGFVNYGAGGLYVGNSYNNIMSSFQLS